MLRVIVEFRDERAQSAVVLSEEGGDGLPLAARDGLCVGHLRVAAQGDECGARPRARSARAGCSTLWKKNRLEEQSLLPPRSLLVPTSMTLLSLMFAAQPAPYLVRTACAHFDRNSCVMHNGAPPQLRCLTRARFLPLLVNALPPIPDSLAPRPRPRKTSAPSLQIRRWMRF